MHPHLHSADPLPLTDAYEHYRLERQNVCAWQYNAGGVSQTVTPGQWTVIPFDVEIRNGDMYSVRHRRFIPGVPGWYDLKTYFTIRISAPLAVLIKPSAFEFGVRIWNRETPTTFVPMCAVTNQMYGAGMFTYLNSACMSGAFGVELDQGMSVDFGFRHISGGDITFIDSIYARFVAERITDQYHELYT